MFRANVKFTVLLALLLIFSPARRVFAYDGAEAFGVVVWDENDWLRLADAAIVGDGYFDGAETFGEEISVHIGGAAVYDLLTGFPAGASGIREGMTVRLGLSGPPSRDMAADEVWMNYGEEGAAAFLAVVSENIQYGEGYCTFTTYDGKYRVTLTADTRITDPEYNFYAPEDIRPGQALFVWVDMVTASSPAQAYPDKAVIQL
ncbi:MAG: hypothetical protein LBR83_07110 [Clostridiales bacterium]|jgi:hypothetical protein|nr:hypothetical protein [Clostridiales bacterium]